MRYKIQRPGKELFMLELSAKTNLLEENDYRYSLQDVKDPVLYRDVYNYDEVPKVAFNHRRVPMSMPADIWITDTSFRDGQQSMNPYTPEQIERIWAEREASEETAGLLEVNQLSNLARIFTVRRYTGKDNLLFSRKYFDALKKQGFFNQ